MGKHLEQALPSVYTLQCLTGKVDNNNNNILFGSKVSILNTYCGLKIQLVSPAGARMCLARLHIIEAIKCIPYRK